MKKNIVITTLVAIFGLTTLSAQSTNRIDKRQTNQKVRIVDGVVDGELTKRERRQLKKQQRRINKLERRANKDGVITARERVKIEKAQNRANRNIRRKKHNARDRN